MCIRDSLSDDPDLRVGLLLFLVTPCIGWYLIFTELADGDTGLGVSLLDMNLILQILLLPLYLLLFAGQAVGVDIGHVLRSIGLFFVAPAIAVAVARQLLGARRIGLLQSNVSRFHLKTAALVVVIVAMFASQGDVVLDNPAVILKLLAPMVAFFVLAFLAAVTVGRWWSLPHDQTALLVFTTTSRNSEASLAIAATAFASPLVSLTVVAGPIIELPLLVLMVRFLLGLRNDQQSDSEVLV